MLVNKGKFAISNLMHALETICSTVSKHSYCIMTNEDICDRILENSSKSHMKSSVFLHVFNDISTYVYAFTEYFLHSFSNLSIEFLVVL